jgi:uncharacterized YigZ family protein
MNLNDEYKTILAPTTANFRDKGSRFLGFVFPVTNTEEIKATLDELKSKYYDATHHCYAWVLGQDRSNYRINDDGEPSGSAGRPIYGQILSADLTNVLLVVVRYYGGTKLGVPGLINAYKSTAREAIDAAEKVTRLVCMSYQVSFQYTHMNQVMKTLKDSGATVNHTDFNNACKLLFTSPRLEALKIIAKLQNLDGVLLEEVK